MFYFYFFKPLFTGLDMRSVKNWKQPLHNLLQSNKGKKMFEGTLNISSTDLAGKISPSDALTAAPPAVKTPQSYCNSD